MHLTDVFVSPLIRRTLTGIALLASVVPALAFSPSSTQAQAILRVPVDSVVVVGNRIFQTAPLLGTIGIFAGDTVSYREVQAAEKRLWDTGRLNDVRVNALESQTGLVTLTFTVEEHPIILSNSIEGLTQMSPDDVWEHIDLTQGLPYTPQLFVRARTFIREELAERGIPFAQVEQELVPIEGSDGNIELVFKVTEGQRVTLADVAFNGNGLFEDSELQGTMGSRPEGFLWFRSGQFQAEALDEDLQTRLPEFYAARGYLDFEVLGDTLIIDPSSGKARLEVDVFEGPQYVVADFSIEGNSEFPTEELEQYYQPNDAGLLQSIGFGGGPDQATIFDQSEFQEATDQVSDLYSNAGYLYSQVSPEIERLAMATEDETPRVSLRWVIDEGQPAYIRRVFIQGNDFTHDRVIRERILILPGDVYSQDRLMRSYQAVSGLGFFEAPLPFPQIQPDPETGDVDVTFAVEERQTGSVNFGTTLGGYTGVAGFVGYDQPNLFGQAKSGSFRWDFGRFQNNLMLQYTDPSIMLSRISGTLSLFNSRDRFFSFSSGRRKVLGASAQVGIPVRGSLFTRVFVGYSISRTNYILGGGNVDDTSLFGRPSGIQSQMSLGIARNTLDHPLFPSVGSDLRWTTELNGGMLGGDGDFTKHTAEGSWWIPVASLGGDDPGSQPMVISLGLRARAGVITGDAGAFPFERFWLGGVQFGEPLRGYEETTLTPRGFVERGDRSVQDIQRLGDSFLGISAEYALRLNNNVSISAFYDAGGIWRHTSEIDPSRLFRGAGLGLDLVTPFGPFGLDYAYGFDKDVPGWQFHFRMGGPGGL